MASPIFDAARSAAGDYLVSESLAAPMLPNVEHHATDVRNTVGVEEYYLETLLAEVTVAGTGGQRLAFINKSFPHSRFDTMVLASSDEPHCAVTDMAPESLAAIFTVARRFVSFVSEPSVADRYGLVGGHFHMAFNFNRDTIDRENSMFYDKRFHLHLNYWPARDVTPSPPVRLGDIASRRMRQRLLDPISFLAPRVVFERLDGRAGGLPLLAPDAGREIAEQVPPGLKARLDGWDGIGDGTLADALTTIHRAAEQAYAEIFEAFTGTGYRAEPWWRPQIAPPEHVEKRLAELPWLSAGSAADLVALARDLRNVGASELAEIRASVDRQISQLAVASLDYSVSVISPAPATPAPLEARSDVMLVVHFKLFSDIGGAGLTWLPGVPIVKVNRSSDAVLSDVEVAERRRFQDEFLAVAVGHLDAAGTTSPGLFTDYRPGTRA